MRLTELRLDLIEGLPLIDAAAYLVLWTEEQARLPPVKRRAHLKDKSRMPDGRTAFEDPYLKLRILLQMIRTDLRRRCLV